MEALLTQAARGTHVLFDNKTIVDVLKGRYQSSSPDNLSKNDEATRADIDKSEGVEITEAEHYSYEGIKKVQEVMTNLVAKRTYHDKIHYLESLDAETYRMVVKAYLQIIENSLKKTKPLKH